jgi:hypothetical protein
MGIEARRPERDEAYWKAKFAAPRPEFDEKTLRWRNASLEDRGRALAGLFGFVDAVGRYPPKQEMFPGFPRNAWHRRPLQH